MRDSVLKRYLIENKSFNVKDGKLTHVSLDGGRISVLTNFNDFFNKYLEGLTRGDTYHLCERPSKVVKMYCDLDFVDDKEITIEEIVEITKKLYDIISEYFGDDYFITICKADSKVLDSGKIKSGYHLIWGELYVDHPKSIRDLFVSKVGFKEAFDEQVYSSGLRMIYSYKTKGEKRPYIPIQTYPENSYDINNKFLALKYTTIRNYNNEQALESIIDIPKLVPKIVKLTYSEIDPVIENFVRNQTIPQWNVPIIKIIKLTDTSIAIKTTSKYCINVGREHNSSGIYFVLNTKGLVQRCYSKKDTMEDRKFCKCCNFKSDIFPLPKNIIRKIFPKFKMTIKEKRESNRKMSTVFASYKLLEQDKNKYIKFSLKTIQELEKNAI